MKIKEQSDLLEEIEKIFPKSRKTVRKNIALVVTSLLTSQQANVPQIAMNMGRLNDKSYSANATRVTRFFKSSEFQINDQVWRSYFNLCFGLLEERGLEQDRLMVLAVDATSDTDKFYILSASISFYGRNIPLYFSMRKYPVSNIKKLEEAFLKELRHLLPKRYKYLIVADRGFGNTRWIDACEKLGFEYLLRTKEDRKIQVGYEKINIKEIEKGNKDLKDIYLVNGGKKTRLIMSFQSKSKEGWYIFTSLKQELFVDIVKQYSKRFHIEKMFQDEKSSGFDIENSRIERYDRYKRMLFCVYMAQMLLMFIGDYINDNSDEIKKKFHFHMQIISAFSR
jgi:hypothetical protein